MGTLSYLREQKNACAAGVTAAGNYTPATNWEIGIPNDSAKQTDLSQWVQNGNVVTVWGSMLTKFDNSSPSFDISVPVTNSNPFTAISGTLKKQRSSEQQSFSAAVFGATTSKVHIGGSGISNTANETWDFKFTYTLT